MVVARMATKLQGAGARRTKQRAHSAADPSASMALRVKRGREGERDEDSLGSGSSSDVGAQPLLHVPQGHHVIDRVLAFDPKTNEYLIHWQGYATKDRTWQTLQDLPPPAVERFRARGFANVGWVFPAEGAKEAFREKHDLIDLGELPVPVPDPNHDTRLHELTKAQRKVYVQWLKRRVGQCEWASGCTHRVASDDSAGGARGGGAAAGSWPVECFDFHHVSARHKIRNVAELPVSIFPAESIWAEAAKCILLCKMHHAIIEHITHGDERDYHPECVGAPAEEAAGSCIFRGHSLYGYVHADANRRQGTQPWTTEALLQARGRPWAARDEPAVAKKKAKRRAG
jgi:hypothetical protein